MNGIEDSVYSILYILTRNSFITNDEFLGLFNTIKQLIDKNKKEKII